MMAPICFRSARVSLRFAADCVFSGFAAFFSNRPYLLFQFCLPHQGGIGVVGLIDAPLRTDELALDQVPQDHFQRLSVFLIEGKQEEREHDKDHAQRRRGRTHTAFA